MAVSLKAIDERVCLVSMPFGAIERPSLALGLLGGHCQRMEIPCDTRYLNLDFAEAVGLADYQWVCGEIPYTAFAGEWLFAEVLYGPRPDSDAAYVEDVLRAEWRLGDADIARLWRLRSQVASFTRRWASDPGWCDYTLVGFTSVFHQNLPSLALARAVKARHPQVTVAFGGANWEEAMGAALKARFDFVDLAFSGEADESWPAVLAARRAGRPLGGIPGVLSDSSAGPTPAHRVEDIDAVPQPDYQPYFDQLHAHPTTRNISPTLLLETARGCWWGQRSHCTFCGLNGSTMSFRSKSPDRVLAEITDLCDRYGPCVFSVVDDILDMRYFRSVLPRLAETRPPAQFFWEVKANLSPSQIRQLRDAGVTHIQPGIESLDDHVLVLMRKGTTALRNIELLKWCKEYGVRPLWNLLYGFPGETAGDYQRISEVLHAIWHLDPPTGWGPVRLDRFSPYFEDPARHDLVNVRPMAAFTCLYPFAVEEVARIAYYFEYDHADGHAPDAHVGDALELVRTWMADGNPGSLTVSPTPYGAVIEDTRRGVENPPRRAVLTGWKAAVYQACDRAHTVADLVALPAVRNDGVGAEDVLRFLGNCRRYQLTLEDDGRWLSLAVHSPAREPSAPDQAVKFLALAASGH
jgi:ribosomal peptide maturation radical SAM protein 1